VPPKLTPFLHREISRHGKPVWYVRRGHARRISLAGEYGSAEFLAAYDTAIGGTAKGHKSPPSRSFAWGLSIYRQSQTWGALSAATRRQRDNIFARVVKTHGRTTLSAWKRGDIAAGRDKRAATPAAARHFVDALRGLFRWLVESGLVANDPTEGVTVAKPKSDGFAIWTETDEHAFRARWPLGTRSARLSRFCGKRDCAGGDAARGGRPHLRGGVIRSATQKTSERIAMAVSPALAEAPAAGPCGN
jgi:hypothetical protein